MRRKSTRNTAKASPEKAATTPPIEVPLRKSRRQSKRRKRTSSASSSDDSDDVSLQTIAQQQQATETAQDTKNISPENEDSAEQAVWKVTQSASPNRGEIQKLKICLTRPSPASPEKMERSTKHRRNKSVGHTDEDVGSSEERVTRRSRRRGSPGASVEEPEEEYEEQEDKKGKGKSKTKHKSKGDKAPQIVQDVQDQTQSEISENVQVTPQSPQAAIDIPVDNENVPSNECETISSGDNETNFVLPNTNITEILESCEPVLKDVNQTPPPESEQSLTKISVIQNDAKPCELLNYQNDTHEQEKVEAVVETQDKAEAVESQEQIETVFESQEQVEPIIESQEQVEPIIESQDKVKVPDAESQEKVQAVGVESDTNQEIIQTQPSQRATEVNEQIEHHSETVEETSEEQQQSEFHLSFDLQDNDANEIKQCNVSMDIQESNDFQQEEENVSISKLIQEQINTLENESMDVEETVQQEKCRESSPDVPEITVLPIENQEQEQEIHHSILPQNEVPDDEPKERSEHEVEPPLSQEKPKSSDAVASTSNQSEIDSNLSQSFNSDVEEVAEEVQTMKEERKMFQVSQQQQPKHQSKGKWGNSSISLELMKSSLTFITMDTVKQLCPDLRFLNEDEVKIETPEIVDRRRSSEYRDRRADRKVSVDYIDSKRFETQSSVNLSEVDELNDPETDNSNIIAMNRKISIVDDTASKLKPPPSPPKNPISEVLHITNLVRPFTLKALKELLERTGKIKENGFWTNRIKSQCYVYYETVEEAEATRNALHGVNWPIGNGKKLIIDFATPNDLEEARKPTPVASEPKSSDKENQVIAVPAFKKEESEKVVKNEERHRNETHVREWDIGKEDLHKSPSYSKDHSGRNERHEKRRHKRTPSPTDDFISRKRKKEEDAPQKLMDDLFRKTKATPSIYWLPLTPEEIATKQQQRLQRMAEHKRRMEETSRGRGDYGRGAPYRRRYD